MAISLKLTDSSKTIENKIKKAIAEELNKIVRKRRAKVLGLAKKAVDGWVSSSPFFASLVSGGVASIAAEFGITAGNELSVANVIQSAIVDSTNIEVGKFTRTLKGGLQIRFQPSNFFNLLALPEGFSVTEKGTNLHWMDWLINKGDQIIVFDYDFQPGLEGRSGGGVMIGGGAYRVNPRYAGVQDNNVFTDMFIGREKDVSKIIEDGLFG